MASLSPCQKPVAPVRHIAGMEILTALVLTVTAIVAGLLFVAVGLFSVASLWWGDLLEPDLDLPASSPGLTKAA